MFLVLTSSPSSHKFDFPIKIAPLGSDHDHEFCAHTQHIVGYSVLVHHHPAAFSLNALALFLLHIKNNNNQQQL